MDPVLDLALEEGVDPTTDQDTPPGADDASSADHEQPQLVVSDQHAAMTVAHTFDKDGDKIYPSLYDTIPTTFGAILIGAGIIGGIQWVVRKIFDREKKEHKALTQFVTAMFALIVGVWIADKIIAGPTANILDPTESKELLTFIKDITLMVFAYYFGTKANVPPDDEGGTDG